MRICPHCKYVDPPEWRHSKYSYWIDWTEFDQFKSLQPELAEKFSKGAEIVEDDLYLYRIMKHGRSVERKAKIDYGNQWNVPMEKRKQVPHDFRKHWFKITPNQKSLTVEKDVEK